MAEILSHFGFIPFIKNIFVFLKISFIVMLISCPLGAVAVTKSKEPSLYETLLPITNFNKEEQNTVMRQAFKNVVVQVSGSEKTLNHPAIQKAVEMADTYVLQFAVQEDAEKNRFVLVKFDKLQINSLLQQSNSPILTRTRPATTVWMVVSREKENPHWVDEESEQALFHQIQAFAKQRKMPLIFPLLDLTEAGLVTEDAIIKDELSLIQQASERYHSEVIWVGKLNQQQSGWYGQWTLVSQGKTVRWDSSDENLEKLCQEAMDELAERTQTQIQAKNVSTEVLSKGSSTPPLDKALDQGKTEVESNPSTHALQSAATLQPSKNRSNKLQLSVSGIKGIEEYAKVMEYLKTIPSVKAVEVFSVQPNQTIFELVATGNREMLAKSIADGKVLKDENEVNPFTNATANTNVTVNENNANNNNDEGVLKYKIAEML